MPLYLSVKMTKNPKGIHPIDASVWNLKREFGATNAQLLAFGSVNRGPIPCCQKQIRRDRCELKFDELSCKVSTIVTSSAYFTEMGTREIY